MKGCKHSVFFIVPYLIPILCNYYINHIQWAILKSTIIEICCQTFLTIPYLSFLCSLWRTLPFIEISWQPLKTLPVSWSLPCQIFSSEKKYYKRNCALMIRPKEAPNIYLPGEHFSRSKVPPLNLSKKNSPLNCFRKSPP